MGAHFFTFIKHYFSFRSGTSVYRNIPFGKVIVVLRSSIFFFTLFYMSFNRNYRHLKSQIKTRRSVNFRAAYNEYLLFNRNRAIHRGRPRSRGRNNTREILLLNALSSTPNSYSVYFKPNAGWLHRAKYYHSKMLRNRAHKYRVTNFLIRGTELVAAPMCGRSSYKHTSLCSFVFSYERMSSIVSSTHSEPTYISSTLWYTYVVAYNSCTLSMGSSFFSLLCSMLSGVPTEHHLSRTHSLVKALYNNTNVTMYESGYFTICFSFATSVYFRYCSNMYSHIRTGVQFLCSLKSVVSFYFYNIINASFAGNSISMSACFFTNQAITISFNWETVSLYLCKLYGFLFIRSFNSRYYHDLCVLFVTFFSAYRKYPCEYVEVDVYN